MSRRLLDKSFLVGILPHVDQAALYNSINQNLAIYSYENTTVWSISVGAYACPSDPAAGNPRPLFPDPPFDAIFTGYLSVPTSYAGSFGSLVVDPLPIQAPLCAVDPHVPLQADGTLTGVSPIRSSSVSDGLCHTMLVVERDDPSSSLERPDVRQVRRLVHRHDQRYPLFGGDPAEFVHRDQHAPSHGGPEHAPGGVNVLFCDGSGRFVKDSIQSWPVDPVTQFPVGATFTKAGYWQSLPRPGLWQAIATRSGGEPVSDDAY